MKKTVMSLGLVIALSATSISFAQQNSTMSGTGSTTMVGKESKTAFDRLNKKGAAMVAAITPTSAKLSSADQALMMEVAKGGMMQLEVSRVAVQKASSEEVRQLAQAEVEEQTGLSAKLMEIAQAKGITLPSTPDAETQRMVTEMQGMTGMSFDRRYVTESGVKGHEKLDAVMGRVKSSASDSNLKAVANAAHPLVKAHLKVSREVMNKMSGNKMGSR
jgi:putative membrane protein